MRLCAQHTVEGEEFAVRRPFPTASLSQIDPFLLFDHLGPVDFEPGRGVGTPWHPYRGFETVTYLLEGDAEHRGSMGNHGFMHSGDTQWMTGSFSVGPTQVDKGILAVIEGNTVPLAGLAASSDIIVLTGRPLGEPVARYGPFVMNTEAEIRQAYADFERRAFGVIPD